MSYQSYHELMAGATGRDGRPRVAGQQALNCNPGRRIRMAKTQAVDSRASREWFARPDDQRFLSLEALRESVIARRDRAYTVATPTKGLRIAVAGDDADDLRLLADDHGRDREMIPTYWAFGQLCTLAGGAPASWMRRLPAPLAAINLEYGLSTLSTSEASLVLGDGGENAGEDGHVRALTSQTYGRIWDSEVVDAVMRVNADGRWKVPAASYATKEPKRASTLYASDRDVFVFLVDPDHAIDIPGESEPLFRGFYTWNSEVGASTFGLSTFMYQRVCDNRTIWGVSDQKELTIRHTGGAPQRFGYEGRRMLQRYANEDSSRIIEGVAAAKATTTGANKDEVVEWLAKKGFTVNLARKAVDSATAERGGAGTVWDVVNGLTAMARSIPHADTRVDLEQRAGRLLSQAASAKK